MAVEPTELVELEVEKVSGVESPANGTSFIVLKASADVCSTCDGTGKIMDGKRDCPDCDGPVGKAEADEIEDALTDGDDDAAVKADLSSAETNDLPDSSFAHIEAGGKKDADGKTTPRSLRHFPVHDAAHVRNALARASSSPFGAKAMPKIKAAAKKFGVEVGKATVSKDGTVIFEGAPKLEEEAEKASPAALDSPSMEVSTDDLQTVEGSGKSGIAGPATGGSVLLAPPVTATGGMSTYEIPAEVGMARSVTKEVAFAVSSLAEFIEQLATQRDLIEQAQKAGLSVTAPEDESVDPSTWDGALKTLARLVFDEVEKSEGDESEDVEKAGRRISGKTESVLRAARDHLTSVIGDGDEQTAGDGDEGEKIQMELTKSEFAESVVEIAREVIKQNGGPTSETGLPEGLDAPSRDADDIQLDGTTTDRPGVTKEELDEVTKQLTALAEGQAQVTELVTKMAQRPRQGGPHLTGQLPEGLIPAGEGRQGTEVAKSEAEQKIETLRKALADAQARGDVTAAANSGFDATLIALTEAERKRFGG